ncbi:MAG: valyl-tRNA synthetase [archaeon GW2011_AR10]|uniref:Valine--tRNA ligase n=1 Tax=Candidatus Iainarchaeum sp. TaxID=3101447 RepID=A0A7J4IZI9_9ARCH|nr:MAG: valyl-tRNA synthetase [archaeon GW2011_AR10]HIH08386.1 valine--tRNA ligase [Candidatus Diapherotrites archaeon]
MADNGPDFKAIEAKWQRNWEKNRLYKFDPNAKGSIYSVDTPPPTVSGRMHLGHAFSYTQADFIVRYKRMRGFSIFYPFGWDDNGLATERLVEKNRKIRAKDFTRKEFIRICLEETRKVEEQLFEDFSSLGLSVDWSITYRTIDELARKIAQTSFLDLHKKGRVYQKEAPSMWCPTCETAIAQAELEDRELESAFNDIYFEIESGEKIVIATTRPELLPACVAVFVHPTDERYKKIVGKKAKVPLFNQLVQILTDERADPSKGTGIVMCCTFGDQTDMEWYYAHKLPLKEAITKDGRMSELAGKFKGKRITEARKEILEELKIAGLLAKQKKIVHSVNVHERCKTEVEIIHTKQWFVKYLDLKEEFIVKAEEIRWFPKHMKVRYDNWIKGLQWDWSISRQRFFGVPFPVWYCKKCGNIILAEEKALPVDPLQDKPSKKCRCGSNEFEAEKDVMDTWFTSSLTPQINGKWTVDEKLFKKLYPMSLRPQAHDIITLWAFNTIVKGLFHQGRIPWKDIMISGHALDPKGRKMSKSLGNAVDPVGMIEKYSADSLRYWAAAASLGEDLPFQEKEMVAGKKFATKLFNASWFVEAATKDFYLGKSDEKKLEFKVLDRWILSRLNKVKKEAEQGFERYEFAPALNAARNFFWLEFADYYIEEIKHRVYNKKDSSRKAAQYTLLKVLLDIVKIVAPIMPHLAEEIMNSSFKNYLKEKSVHLEEWPVAEERWVDEKSEKAALAINNVISKIRKFKSQNSIALNREVSKAVVIAGKDDLASLKENLEEIRKIMFVKEIEVRQGKEFSVEVKA